jgi:hypothetical protein
MITLSFVATLVVCIDPVTAAQLTTALLDLINACLKMYLLIKQIEKL